MATKSKSNGALAQARKELTILHQISETISSTLNLDEVLKHIIDLVIRVTQGDAGLIYLYDSHSHDLVLRASKMPHPKVMGKIRLKLGEGITGWAAQHSKPVVIGRNSFSDPRFKVFSSLPEDRYHALLSVPMISRGELIGVINVQHRRPHRHSPGETELIAAIAKQVGSAIENARLFEETKNRTLQIETLSRVSSAIVSHHFLDEMLDLIVTMTAETLGSKVCSIMLLGPGKKELVIKATQSASSEYRHKAPLKVGSSVSGKAVLTRQPVIVPDVTRDGSYGYPDIARKEGLCSLLCVPMMIKDRVVGVINAYTSKPHLFTKHEIDLMKSIANQAAVAIEHTALLDEANTARAALESRKIVERAKGILMASNHFSEDQAFRFIQKQSMNSRKSMKEIADAIILSQQINP
jgi:GAF domain-containing protein